MYKIVKIDEKDMELTANAATPFRFKQLFQKDLMQILGNEERAMAEADQVIAELAYVMSKQAEKADMNKLNMDEFLTWLEGFSALAFVNASEEILSVYMDSSISSSTP